MWWIIINVILIIAGVCCIIHALEIYNTENYNAAEIYSAEDYNAAYFFAGGVIIAYAGIISSIIWWFS